MQQVRGRAWWGRDLQRFRRLMRLGPWALSSFHAREISPSAKPAQSISDARAIPSVLGIGRHRNHKVRSLIQCPRILFVCRPRSLIDPFCRARHGRGNDLDAILETED